jgi:hypothetical protein
MVGNDVDAARVANEDDAVSQLFGIDMKMKDTAIFVDD